MNFADLGFYSYVWWVKEANKTVSCHVQWLLNSHFKDGRQYGHQAVFLFPSISSNFSHSWPMLIILVSIPMFDGSRNPIKVFSTIRNYHITAIFEMTDNMATMQEPSALLVMRAPKYALSAQLLMKLHWHFRMLYVGGNGSFDNIKWFTFLVKIMILFIVLDNPLICQDHNQT